MTIHIPENLTSIARVFSDAGVPVYAVGGLVRNTLLGIPPADVDICSRLTPEALVALCADTPVRVIPKAAEFGTVELHTADACVEHTTFRAECYQNGGAHRPDFVEFGGTLEMDAIRRDFSVNALYADLLNGEVRDPTGGLRDLEKGLLRTTSIKPDDILRSDALRVLRLVRFACQLGFELDQDTWAAALRNAEQLTQIAVERRQAEFNRILLCDGRYPALGRDELRSVLRGLRLLDGLNVWHALIPEVAQARGVQQRSNTHRYDVQEHLFHACAAMPPVLTLRLAGLLHDIGKPQCRAENGNLYDHDQYSARITRRILFDLRYPKAICAQVCKLVREHMFDVQNTAREGTLRVKFAEWGRDMTRDMICMREADIIGCGYEPNYVCVRWRTLFEQMQLDGTPFSENEVTVTGTDIMAELDISSGKAVGRIKRRLFAHCARHPADNTPECLKKRMHDYKLMNEEDGTFAKRSGI
ncbi:MAG: HD domain-containing protein [Clostridia bacterium]